MRKKLFAAAVLLLFAPFLAFASTPDLVLKDFNGKDRNINEFIGKGKWVVVMIWAHDCHVCNQEVHHMTFFHDDHKKKDAIVLGVTIDGMEKINLARDFLKRHSINFPSLIAEPEHEVLMKFGGGPFFGTPTFYIYDPKGELVARNIGPVTGEDIERFIKNSSNQGTKENKKTGNGKKG